MRFEWDEKKNTRNRTKHGVSFETAVRVFDDLFQLSRQDRRVSGEERWQTMGMVGNVVLLVAHTYRVEKDEEVIRIISARKATSRERYSYEEGREEPGA